MITEVVRLRKLIHKAGMTQKDVAEKCCVCERTVRYWLQDGGKKSANARACHCVELAVKEFLQEKGEAG